MVRTFPRQMASIASLVDFVREFLLQEGLPEDAAFDLDLVIEELFTNLVKYGTGSRGDVDVGLESTATGVVLTLREYDADRYDPTAAPDVDIHRPIEDRRPGGLGIHLVRQLSTDFRYEWQDRTGLITVTMKEPS
jgi:anti-sigma regulatory factor (Ser/Thr protein kinase)